VATLVEVLVHLPQVIGDILDLAEEDEDDKAGQTCPNCGFQLLASDGYFFGWRRSREGIVYTICPRCGADWPD
jgi:ribosomal protein S27AE